MRKIIIVFVITFISLSSSFSQLYIENGGFELWEKEGTPLLEPIQWNSFKTASGSFVNYAPSNPVATKSTDAHSGTFSVKISTVQGPFGVKVNGNLTNGRVNMGSTTPTSTLNHNYTDKDNSEFNQKITSTPDSLIFWYKYKSVDGDSGIVSSQIHNNTNYQFPENTEAKSNAIAYASKTLSSQSKWARVSLAYDYSGQASEDDVAYVLINLSSSAVPGGGKVGSTLYIDDIQLKYNELGINQEKKIPYQIYNYLNNIYINMNSNDIADLIITEISGKRVLTKKIINNKEKISLNTESGIYLVTIQTKKGLVTKKIVIN